MTRHSIHDLTDATAYDSNGDKLGSVKEVYINDSTGQPDFAEVGHGLFGLQSSIVPLRGHSLRGDELRLAFPKDLIKDAPDIKHDEHLSEEDHATIYRHFGLEQVADVHTYERPGQEPAERREDDETRRGGLAERERNLTEPQGTGGGLHEDPMRGGAPLHGGAADRQRATSDHELGLDRTPEQRAMRGTSTHGMSDEPREYERDVHDHDLAEADAAAVRDQRATPGPDGPVDADGRPLPEEKENYPRTDF